MFCCCLQDQTEQNDFTALASLVFPLETRAFQVWRYMTSCQHKACPFYFWWHDYSTNFSNFNSAIKLHSTLETSTHLVISKTTLSIRDCFCLLSTNVFTGWSASDSTLHDGRALSFLRFVLGCTTLYLAFGQYVCSDEVCWFGILLRYNCFESMGLFFRCCLRKCCLRRQQRRLCFGLGFGASFLGCQHCWCTLDRLSF